MFGICVGDNLGPLHFFPEQLANDHIIKTDMKMIWFYDPFMGSGITSKMKYIE